MKSRYAMLKQELASIARVVKTFPETVQIRVFDLMVSEYLSGEIPVNAGEKDDSRMVTAGLRVGKNEIAGIARLDDKGAFHLTVRDPKAQSRADAVKRLTYLTIRSYLLLKKDAAGVSRKDVVNPVLEDWRVYDGNARPWLSNDKGIIRDDDRYSLDRHATNEADQFIKEILDDKVAGSWNPGTSRKRRSRPSSPTK